MHEISNVLGPFERLEGASRGSRNATGPFQLQYQFPVLTNTLLAPAQTFVSACLEWCRSIVLINLPLLWNDIIPGRHCQVSLPTELEPAKCLTKLRQGTISVHTVMQSTTVILARSSLLAKMS